MQRQIIMGFDVRYNITRIICRDIGRLRLDIVQDGGNGTGTACDESRLPFRTEA
ncbi:hypothetical protein D3C81_1508940 [compost metagenome]